jgi:GT2 family glycosyltransferase
MKVGIVIPFHGQIPLLIECINSIFEKNVCEHEIAVFLIDNGTVHESGFNHSEIVPDYPNSYYLDINKQNVGVTKAWNQGLKRALKWGAEVVCISNSDVVFGPMVVINCVSAAFKHGVAFPFSKQGGPKEVDFDQKALEKSRLDFDAPGSVVDTGGFAGWCFFLSRKTIEQVGVFDEQFTLWYQDTDYHWRLVRENPPIRPMEVRCCYLHHYESRTILSMPQQFECYGWRAEDAKRFAAKYPPAKKG